MLLLSTCLTPLLWNHAVLLALLLALSAALHKVQVRLVRARFFNTKGCQTARSEVRVADPFLGLDFLFRAFFRAPPQQYLESTWLAFQQLGATYVERRWTWQAVYTCDARNIRHVLSADADSFDLPAFRTSVISSLFGKGIFVLSGHSWRAARAVLRRGFRKDDTGPFLAILERHFCSLTNHVPAAAAAAAAAAGGADEGEDEVDLQPLLMGLTMDVATEFLMGHSTRMLDIHGDHSREQCFVDDYMVCSRQIIRQMQLGPLHCLKVSFQAHRARRRLYRYLDAFIEESFRDADAEGASSRPGFLAELSALSSDRKRLGDHILHILLASRDTTSSLMSNLFFFLAKNPDIYSKLRHDVLYVAGNEPPTAAQLNDMTYLKWCINESLRLHPVIPTNARIALQDTTLPRGGGPDGSSPIFVRKGTVVFYNIYAMHRDEAVFGPDPEAFVPERWENLRPGWAYLPFNGGTRTCVGQQYALLETRYVVARMVQTYQSLESRDDEDWKELYALALCSKNGTRVAATLAS